MLYILYLLVENCHLFHYAFWHKKWQVLETLAALDHAIHSPHATTQVKFVEINFCKWIATYSLLQDFMWIICFEKLYELVIELFGFTRDLILLDFKPMLSYPSCFFGSFSGPSTTMSLTSLTPLLSSRWKNSSLSICMTLLR